MKTPLLRCSHCGGSNLRRSKRQSFAEAVRMVLGIYPFRCMNCGVRSNISVWLFSKLAMAKCPRCLSTKLATWPEKYFKLNAIGNLMITFGARRYRCHRCRCNFLSFRPREIEAEQPEQEVPTQDMLAER